MTIRCAIYTRKSSEDGLDQFFVNEPAALLERTAEAALIDPTTPRILDGHVLAAAYEGPLTPADARFDSASDATLVPTVDFHTAAPRIG